MENKSTFSPTLARLLTAPEKGTENHQTQSNNIPLGGVASISDILCGTKVRNYLKYLCIQSIRGDSGAFLQTLGYKSRYNF